MAFNSPAQPAWIGAAGRFRTGDHPVDATRTWPLAGRLARLPLAGWPHWPGAASLCPSLHRGPPGRDALTAAFISSGQRDGCCSRSTPSPRLTSQLLLHCCHFICASKEVLSPARPGFHRDLFAEVKRIASASASNASLVLSCILSKRLHTAEGVRTPRARDRGEGSWWVLLAGSCKGRGLAPGVLQVTEFILLTPHR